MNNLIAFCQENKTAIICIIVLVLLIVFGLISKALQKSTQSVDQLKINKRKIKEKHQTREKLAKEIVTLAKDNENIKNNLLDEINKDDSKEILTIVEAVKNQQTKDKANQPQKKVLFGWLSKKEEKPEEETPLEEQEEKEQSKEQSNNKDDSQDDDWEE